MKKLVLVTIITFLINGCNLVNSNPNEYSILSPKFSIVDTLGKTTTQFHSGESFELSFSLINITGDTVSYSWSAPMVAFRIYKGDTIVTSSYYGCPEPNFYATSSLLFPAVRVSARDKTFSTHVILKSWIDTLT